ncbi:protealysin inhibitor emfourin [Corallococcus llansteffanensis]|uniref:Uncharacterized protein n=1 Tax=Corallococcus llansteffanensis TaxID=2316731 RepID=A0A3A8QKS9_9BACT|nr:protealysin inhibitor emfourin [Corallococcus llansteffanensis]RKH65442.1 hypothetical protein D7V93_06000 [Corallococcus llansteffanensis]
MHIELKREGGIAFLPGLNRPRTFDLRDLPPAQAEALTRSVHAASFFQQPAVVGTAAKGAADQTRYTLTIEEGGRRHTVQLLEPVQEPHLRELLELLKQAERDLRREAARPHQ